MQKTSRKLLFFIIYGTMVIFGFVENIKGVSYPLIKGEFGVSYDQQGLMVSLLSYSYVLFCMVAGFCQSRFGIKRTLISGFICTGLGLTGVFFMPGFWTCAAALLMAYAGFGFFEVGLNSLATQVFTVRAALLMNLMHFFYGVGGIGGPKTAGFLTQALNLDWRQVYLFSLPLVLLVFFPALAARFPEAAQGGGGMENAEGSPQKEKGPSFLYALKTPMVWLFSIVLGFMEVVEMGSSNWGGLYFLDVYGMDPRTAGASFISVFFILFTCSRLFSGFIIEKIGYMRSLFTAVFCMIGIFILGFCLGPRGLYVLPILGFFIAILWPTIMAVAMGYFGPHAPVMTGAMIALGGALNSGLQLLIGLTNRILGPAWGYRSCVLYAVILAGLMILLQKKMRKTFT
jgi:fucose permease